MLPHAVAFNTASAPDAMARVTRALASTEAAQGLFDLAGELGAPRSLREIGMPENGLDEAADIAAMSPYWNPRPPERTSIRALLQDAYEGRRPDQALYPTTPTETVNV